CSRQLAIHRSSCGNAARKPLRLDDASLTVTPSSSASDGAPRPYRTPYVLRGELFARKMSIMSQNAENAAEARKKRRGEKRETKMRKRKRLRAIMKLEDFLQNSGSWRKKMNLL